MRRCKPQLLVQRKSMLQNVSQRSAGQLECAVVLPLVVVVVGGYRCVSRSAPSLLNRCVRCCRAAAGRGYCSQRSW
jgi:hypothetical protein